MWMIVSIGVLDAVGPLLAYFSSRLTNGRNTSSSRQGRTDDTKKEARSGVMNE